MNNEVVGSASSGLVLNSLTNSSPAELNILIPTDTTSGNALSKIETKTLYMKGHDDGSETNPQLRRSRLRLQVHWCYAYGMTDIDLQRLEMLKCGKKWELEKFIAAKMRGKTISEVLRIEPSIPWGVISSLHIEYRKFYIVPSEDTLPRSRSQGLALIILTWENSFQVNCTELVSTRHGRWR